MSNPCGSVPITLKGVSGISAQLSGGGGVGMQTSGYEESQLFRFSDVFVATDGGILAA
jgi:hypothetical protein